ncbi:hypothetical protein [Ovoidimarina sediminis]|uniref:hypothetical protein n=1 Tax=Ovoidimarina sediminis TaxID=3079856 RepID=UPI002913F09C|nr:hypothetical protein [Rhodophyticola sp. MJ-SS7]MDU8945683.1 hypothetical protein [Rhodophyticola sp. MJ-SS7]
MPGTIRDILGRLGLDRQGKAARTRDLDAAQQWFLHCAQGALGEAGQAAKDGGPRDPRSVAYEKIEARLAAAGVGAIADLPEGEVSELAFQERAILSGEAGFETFLATLSNDDRAYARHLREAWEKEVRAFGNARNYR